MSRNPDWCACDNARTCAIGPSVRFTSVLHFHTGSSSYAKPPLHHFYFITVSVILRMLLFPKYQWTGICFHNFVFEKKYTEYGTVWLIRFKWLVTVVVTMLLASRPDASWLPSNRRYLNLDHAFISILQLLYQINSM